MSVYFWNMFCVCGYNFEVDNKKNGENNNIYGVVIINYDFIEGFDNFICCIVVFMFVK